MMPAMMVAEPRQYVPPVIAPTGDGQDDPTDRRYRHLDRCRRVLIGSSINIVFEDRHTLWFRMQELARYARTVGRATHKQMEWYKRLMPGNGRLTAAVSVGLPGCRPSATHADIRQDLAQGTILFRSDTGVIIEGRYMQERVSDSLIGMVGWIEFDFSAEERIALADTKSSWYLVADTPHYHFESEPLIRTVRLSLASNLA